MRAPLAITLDALARSDGRRHQDPAERPERRRRWARRLWSR
jgi:hypothetical protein